ncbi:uncharacterized protein MONOS_10624c1 [Monocercomonoides exilis]|uniref:uncharacterized protein n=1 Tax=Monocercomonoides exilis TaxID=2049356 RepID=UPI00355A9BB4|nr:hypothetical protein MONOS_10624c2 [Monocercomonoides exilis]KAH7832229.1 hypothetical protein MONOS_10624c1 [Monocercomonoides exilis]|eukprot:MONOS_10624.1-p1 / transcript=MONOS_10624.1 / gene=MONOS_10624 / organism=Monocercomonoides_exilis_PA203 / gene_product=unspecified product / transcript_product=unspecified product / location=Mono_scaffold00490:42074-42493(-) / protein_length=140 / sequence_SO=supercontig / SO=protein_coding / is_pseudo=false
MFVVWVMFVKHECSSSTSDMPDVATNGEPAQTQQESKRDEDIETLQLAELAGWSAPLAMDETGAAGLETASEMLNSHRDAHCSWATWWVDLAVYERVQDVNVALLLVMARQACGAQHARDVSDSRKEVLAIVAQWRLSS